MRTGTEDAGQGRVLYLRAGRARVFGCPSFGGRLGAGQGLSTEGLCVCGLQGAVFTRGAQLSQSPHHPTGTVRGSHWPFGKSFLFSFKFSPEDVLIDFREKKGEKH